MIRRKIHIINKLGLHARAAAKFVTLASKFECDIKLIRGERSVNGKSIMGIMMLAASKGTELGVTLNGADEEHAFEEIKQLVDNKFNEEES